MCAGNIGTVYHRWDPERKPKPRWMINMEVTYRCRNFDRIREWAVQNEVPGWDDSVPSRLTA